LAVSIRFGSFVVNPQTRQVLRDDTEIHLPTKAFDLLCALIERRPDVVPKNELLRLVWPDAYVVDANLNVVIGEIRRALGDDPQRPRYIRTVHGIGYAFCGEAIDEKPVHPREPRGARFWIVWKDRTFVLTEGDNVIGRNPECQIWLNETGVSRRHARIHVDGDRDRVVVEDLNSTNGTCVGQTPIATPHVLRDGDVLQIGSVELTFRAWSATASRETERIARKRR
jgi:DNA-binding winged helix-turn-helix (wHTH) protein